MSDSSIELRKVDKSHFPVQQVQVARENDLLYDRFGIANLDDRELTLSIRESGIQEPLTLSADHVLLSGHRRFAAARYLGLKTVPVRIVDIVFEGLTKDERLATLRLHNQQREKSPGERIREKLLEIDPDHAHIDLLRRRVSEVIGPAAANRPKVTPRGTHRNKHLEGVT